MNTRQVLIIEGCANIVIALAKLFVGLLTYSTAILADAFHSLTDVGNNVVAWFALKHAEQPADDDHPYGHQKFVPLAIFFLATLLVVLAVEVVSTAIARLGQPVENSKIGFAVLVGALIFNILLTLWQHYWAKKLNSTLLEADASHTLSDVLSSIAIIAGWQLAVNGWLWLDTFFAIVMAGVIAFLAFRLFKQAIPILVDSTRVNEQQLRNAVLAIDKVAEIRQLRTRYDGLQHIGDITVIASKDLSLEQTHQLADRVEQLMADEFGVSDTVVHIEPDEH